MCAIALIILDTLTKGGELKEGYKIGHYMEVIRVGVLTSVSLFIWPAIVFFRFLF